MRDTHELLMTAELEDMQFMDKPSQEILLSRYVRALKDPCQTSRCCGHHLSHGVALQLAVHFGNMGVQCSMKAQDCHWKGELGDLVNHGKTNGECCFVAVRTVHIGL